MLVASFYSPRPEIESKLWNCDYDQLLMLVESSCRRFGLEHLVISNCPRPAPLRTFLTFLPDNLMQAFIFGQRQMLRELQESCQNLLFIGADCLFTRNPSGRELIEESDITITLSSSFVDCLMNCGAIWCNDLEKCFRIWDRAYQTKKLVDWGDDQRAIYSSILEYEEEGWLNVKRVECEGFNWAPDGLEDDCRSVVVHFRAKRKQFMANWAKKHLDLDPVAIEGQG